MPITSAHRPNPDHDDHPDIHGSGDKRPERPYIRRAKSHQSRGLIDACLARESGHASTCDTAVVTPCSRAMGHRVSVGSSGCPASRAADRGEPGPGRSLVAAFITNIAPEACRRARSVGHRLSDCLRQPRRVRPPLRTWSDSKHGRGRQSPTRQLTAVRVCRPPDVGRRHRRRRGRSFDDLGPNAGHKQ